MTFLFWDIDGTLLTTARGGVLALEDACLDVTGHALNLQAIESDGLTDHQLAVKILEQAGVQASPGLVERFLRSYERQLPARLPLRQGRVLDNVREILAYLHEQRPTVHSMLLTGNTRVGAGAKLAHYGLQAFFEGGAFSEDSGPRAGIAARALAMARQRFVNDTVILDHVFVVGDTPHDIECARAIGARAIAVASGVFSSTDLSARGAWAVLDGLPEPRVFDELISRPVGLDRV